ncbi:BEM_collapsed_G0037400.mRNA.1.CDS.1 [Saccharomyces cerevisiae]|nr:BEM_collapsed_G0037400.mRNA.1.CDS.1 [Saccharomyces cerevisiae]
MAFTVADVWYESKSLEYRSHLCIVYFDSTGVNAFFNFGHHQQQQQQQQQSYEDQVLNNPCDGYLCPTPLTCVAQQKDCPCPFPKSQLKCVLPDNKFVCISKPATHNEKFRAIYDDPCQGPQSKEQGV